MTPAPPSETRHAAQSPPTIPDSSTLPLTAWLKTNVPMYVKPQPLPIKPTSPAATPHQLPKNPPGQYYHDRNQARLVEFLQQRAAAG
ncbi:hypothetical protein PtA15_10A274 [Puccinia triticina]|uniref:Uncharacterized protein n=1 Tax=Puccinia triticina TaxID=208348 RepID=A0ABY7CU67_9BASI|nr:uncharacterized protein PtA15_10A274 [Puccinia triticina]WAQ88853.1 hypothetical protein PtA15_10A274 [Puccinia triticina]